MKTALVTFFISWFTAIFGQVTIAIPEYNVLYRGYDNRLELAAPEKNAYTIIESPDAWINKLSDSCYIVRVSTTADTIDLLVRDLKTHAVISTKQYRVLNMPLPEAFFGDSPDGSQIATLNDEFFIRYDDVFPLKSEFIIREFELWVEGVDGTFRSAGNKLTNQHIQTIKMAKSKKGGEKLNFSVMILYTGSDEISRKKSLHFTF